MRTHLWDGLPVSAWIARCALQLRRCEPTLDSASAVNQAQALLDRAEESLPPAEILLISPEDAARRSYASL